jgi:YidC/Oxa1 family membrane protein insertase
MEKNTILAIVLSVVVMTGFWFLQYKLYPPKEEAVQTEASGVSPAETAPAQAAETVAAEAPAIVPAETPPDAEAETSTFVEPAAEKVVIETKLLTAVLSNSGGDMVSYKLKEHDDSGEYVDMVLAGSQEPHAFGIAFGGANAAPVTANFRVSRPAPTVAGSQVVEFSRDFRTASGQQFTLTKRYDFRDDEYMFALTVTIDGAALNSGGAAYTLGFGPQIGPRFEKLDNRYEYRRFYSFANNKRKQLKASDIADTRFTWAGIEGKYFTALVVPDNTLYEMSFSDRAEPGLAAASRFYLTRPALSQAHSADVYHFYLGPKNQKDMTIYDTGANSFKMRDLQFIKAANTSGFLSWLETILKWGLSFFYKIVHNYGVAIILLTLLVKILLFPLSIKSSEASFKMQALAPKIKEIQEKYKDNPAKMNAEMGALYKKEGHNPMSGCLPMLIQLPLLWAMYNLFNTHFDLRGASFIPGWIPDLSLPESIIHFENFRVPILGWTDIRLLPFIYFGSQMLYGVATRTPEQQGNPSMKMMLFVMPILFFFILYDVPSGLLVFWIFSNLFTLVQQIILNRWMARKKAEKDAEAAAAAGPKPVIAPPRKKKKR